MKYRPSLDGISVTQYLYSTESKLAIVKQFRDEACTLIGQYDKKDIKYSHVAHLKDYSSTEQCKFAYKLSSFPMNPTALNQ